MTYHQYHGQEDTGIISENFEYLSDRRGIGAALPLSASTDSVGHHHYHGNVVK